MKTFTLLCFLTCSITLLQAQSGPIEPDTIIQEFFFNDPTPFMLPAPTGSDDIWVNYDVDQQPGLCVANDDTPHAWYWESDLGFATPDETDNYALTSCSFLDLPPSQSHNRNWLIIRQIMIPDTNYALAWRSLAFQGPMYLDGYRVLVSTGSNDPAIGDFTDTLFSAAQMISGINGLGSLDPGDYNFTPGYIQAAGYTNPDYYFLDTTNPAAHFYRGRLEPHTVSLKNYAGQSIYIAFLHDSDDDNLIQIDDILVANTLTVNNNDVSSGIRFFRVLGNPARNGVYLSWSLMSAQDTRLRIVNQKGQLMLEKSFARQQENNWYAEIRNWTPGIYFCTLQTPSGHSTIRLVKI